MFVGSSLKKNVCWLYKPKIIEFYERYTPQTFVKVTFKF